MAWDRIKVWQMVKFTTAVVSTNMESHKQSPRDVVQKGVLRDFAKFSWKHLCRSLFFNKVVGLKPATFLKKKLRHTCFHVNFAKFLRTPFLSEPFWWLFLESLTVLSPNMQIWPVLSHKIFYYFLSRNIKSVG